MANARIRPNMLRVDGNLNLRVMYIMLLKVSFIADNRPVKVSCDDAKLR